MNEIFNIINKYRITEDINQFYHIEKLLVENKVHNNNFKTKTLLSDLINKTFEEITFFYHENDFLYTIPEYAWYCKKFIADKNFDCKNILLNSHIKYIEKNFHLRYYLQEKNKMFIRYLTSEFEINSFLHSKYLNEKMKLLQETSYIYIFLGILKESQKKVVKIGRTKFLPTTQRFKQHYKKDFETMYIFDIFPEVKSEHKFHSYMKKKNTDFVEEEIYRQNGTRITEIYKIKNFSYVYKNLYQFLYN